MDIAIEIKALILGLVEGATEFVPVSSTGHLIVAADFLGFRGEVAKTFEIAIQLGAILAVVWNYHHRLAGVVKGKAFVNTLQNWWQQILNYFDGRFNNGFEEGVNFKIKMLNRRRYGYSNFNSFPLHVLVAFDPISR